MRHAILIMAHKNIEQVLKLVRYFEKDCDIFIHLDKKQKYDPQYIKELYSYQQVQIVSQKFDVYWGGNSVLFCEMFLMEKAFNHRKYDYFHLISGQDYPVRPLHQFLDYFQVNNGKEFIQYVKLPHPKWENGTFRRFQYYYPYDYVPFKKNPKEWVYKHVMIQKKMGVKRSIPIDFEYLYGGSQWFSITNNAVKILLSFTHNHSSFYKSLWMTFAPEECYVATVLLNLINHNNIIPSNCRFILWRNENGNIPANLSREHFYYLLENNYLFARKMEMPYCSELLSLIDRYLHKQDELSQSETGAWIYNGFLKYEYDKAFFNYIGRLCQDLSIISAVDMGCGPGFYVSKWRRMGLPFAGYDANPFTTTLSMVILPKGDTPCGVADLTGEMNIFNKFDLVICKDVLPFIPIRFHKRAIDNLVQLSSHMIVLSWHVPSKLLEIAHEYLSEETIISQFQTEGFCVERYLTQQLRFALKYNECCVLIKKGHQLINN